MAQALGRALRDRGDPIAAVASRTPNHAARAAEFIGCDAVSLAELPAWCGRVLIAVSDDAVEVVAGQLAAAGMRGIALHTCGSRGPEAIASLPVRGVLHPLQTIASPEQGVAALPGSSFALSGDAAAVEWALQLVRLLKGVPLEIAPERMPLYHAAAVMASNNLIALVDAAVMLMVSAGLDTGIALRALAPLIRTSADNAIAAGPERALTGPIQRGDAATVRRHLEALAGAPPSAGQLYRAAGLQALDLARRRGLDESHAREIEELLRRGPYA